MYMSAVIDNTSTKQLALSLPLFPFAALMLFNFTLSLILNLYFLLRYLFFGHPVNSTALEKQQILEKLFIFFSFKFVLIGLVVEPGIVDMVMHSNEHHVTIYS